MKQTAIISVLAMLLFGGTMTACQRSLATLPAKLGENNLCALQDRLDSNVGGRMGKGKKGAYTDSCVYRVGTFDKIECSSVVSIHFTQGSETRVVAKLQGGTPGFLDVSTHNGCLKISRANTSNPKDGYSIDSKNNVYLGDLEGSHSEVNGVDLYVTAPSLRKISISGVSSFSADHLNVPELEVRTSGVASLKLPDLTCGNTTIVNSGVSTISATIKGNKLSVDNSGTGKLALRFDGEVADFRNSGMGSFTAEVACQQLNATYSGMGKMTLKGTADQTTINASGMAVINTKGLNNY